MPQPHCEFSYQVSNLAKVIEVVHREMQELDFGRESDGTRNHALDRIAALINVTLDIVTKTASDLEERIDGGMLPAKTGLTLGGPEIPPPGEPDAPASHATNEEAPDSAIWNPPRFPGFVPNPAFIPGTRQFPAEYPQIVDPVLTLIDVAESARTYFNASKPKNLDLNDEELDARFAATIHPFHDAIVHATPTPLTPKGALALCDYVIEYEEEPRAPTWLLALHDFMENLVAQQEADDAV